MMSGFVQNITVFLIYPYIKLIYNLAQFDINIFYEEIKCVIQIQMLVVSMLMLSL